MLHPNSRRVKRTHSAPHSCVRSTLPQSPTPIYTGNGNILYIDATPPSSVVSMRNDEPGEVIQTPSFVNGRPVVRRTRHLSDQPHRVTHKPSHLGPPTHYSTLDRRSMGRASHSKRHGSTYQTQQHRSFGNLTQVQPKPGSSSWYNQPQEISRWYEVDDSGSQTSLVSDHHIHLVPPLLTIQPSSSQNLSILEPESSTTLLNDYPPSPYEFESETIGPFSTAFEEMERMSPSPSMYGEGNTYIPSPLAFDGQMSARSNILHIPMSPISPYAVVRPKSPALSKTSPISPYAVVRPRSPTSSVVSQTSTTGQNRLASIRQQQSTPVKGQESPGDGLDPMKLKPLPRLSKEERSVAVLKIPVQSGKHPTSPGHTSQSLDCLDGSATAVMSPRGNGEGLGKDGHSSSSPSLRVNGCDPSVFRFPRSSASETRGRRLLSHSLRKTDYRPPAPRTLSHFPRSTSQMSVQSLSQRSDVSVSAGSVISTRSDMWGGRRGGTGGHMRFSRQYCSYRRPKVPNMMRGQRAYKSFRQEMLLRSMCVCVCVCDVW